MSPLDRAVLAERTLAIQRHLARVAEKLPADPAAAGFRNVVAHAYENLDLTRVHRAAVTGPAELLAFVAALDRATPRP